MQKIIDAVREEVSDAQKRSKDFTYKPKGWFEWTLAVLFVLSLLTGLLPVTVILGIAYAVSKNIKS